MSRRKGTRIRRMAAVLLSAVLITGMLWDAVPVTVLAQETAGQQEDTDGSRTETAAGDTKPEEKTETTPAEGTGSGGQEETDPEGQEEPGTTEGGDGTEKGDGLTGQKPGGGMEEELPKPGDGTGEEQPKPGDTTEEETEPGTVGGNEAAPQRVMMAAPAPQADGQRDVTFTFKIYGYHPDKFPLELNNVVAIWSKNAEEFIEGEENKKAVTEEGYTCWSYTFRNLDVNTRYDVKEKNALGQMYTIPTGSGTEYERIDYAVNFYDGNELKGVQYVTSGNHAWEDSAPVLTKDDCAFAGWVTTDGGKDAFDFKTAIAQITNVYASWTPDTPSGNNIASGTDWVLDKDGKLTISSDTGMTDWNSNGKGKHSSKVTGAELLDGVKGIPFAAFQGCSGMKSITISENVTSITMWAFLDCSSLTEITIPSKVGDIGNAAFGRCSSLTTVTMLCETPPTIGADVFTDSSFFMNKKKGIHVPKGKAEDYKKAWPNLEACIADDTTTGDNVGWSLDGDGKLTITSDDGTTAWRAFVLEKKQIKSVEIQDGVTSIGEQAFFDCSSLENIAIPSGVTSIGKEAFYRCSNLTSIAIPEKVTSIGASAFGDCIKLASVTMDGETPPSLGGYAFNACPCVEEGIKGIHVPAGTLETYKSKAGWSDYKDHITDGTTAETHEHNDVSFTAWTATDSLPDAAGNYYLTQNVTLADTWDVPGETTLCLNGKTISASGTDEYRVITIPESCTLNLYDCQNAGNITGGKGGGVSNNGTFCMYGGKISGNSCEDTSGGGVNNQGVFQMYGGEISGNEAVGYGGVGGGVYIGNGTFAMYGGKISGNTSNTGGGVGCVSIIGTFITIIYDEPLTIGGGAVISGNTCDGKENNVCLNNGQIITIESANPLSGSAKIGVTTKTAPTDVSPVNITGENSEDYSKYFHSDNPDYAIVNSGNNVVQLVAQSQSYTVTVNSGTGGGEYVAGDTVTIRANTPVSGKQFDKWAVNSGSVTLASATSSTTTFTMPAEAVTVTATYKNKSGGGHSGGGSGSGGDHSGDSGNADGGNNDNGGSDNGSGSSGENDSAGGSTGNTGATGAGTSKTPGAAGTGQPRIKQEKEGNIRKEVRVEGADTLDAAVETSLSELADIVLTKEEKQKAAGGTDVKVVLDVKDASAVVSAADKALVEKALNGSLAKGYTLGQYLDISLYKVVGSSRNLITETNRKITITIDVPDSLKNNDAAKTRTFAVIRVHDGKAELLADLDDNADTITIKTDRFSTYAVVYKDTAGGNSGRQSGNGKPGVVRVSANSDGKNPGGGQDGEPKTGDSTPVELSATLAMIAGFAYLLLYFADRERGMTEETKKELVSRLVGWAKQGGRIRKYLALAAIFILLVYYHSIGKKTETVQTRTLHFLQNP